MKKQFFRVKQIADQTFLRAEKSDALTEDLASAEKRVDSIKVCCHTMQKKISGCQIDFGSETSVEKRLKKIPQVILGASMLENGGSLPKNSILGETLRECGGVQTKLGADLLQHCTEVEKLVLKPVAAVLENEIHSISKLRKQLGKLVLDMDSARTRYQGAERQQHQQGTGIGAMAKAEVLKEELDEAQQRVEQCRDQLATEMFLLLAKEPALAQSLLELQELQAAYHRNALACLDASLPHLQSLIHDFPLKPTYSCSLEEHLRVSQREIAQVVETCVTFLLEYGIQEEGLLRVAGSASKMKKLKSAFDAGIELDLSEYVRDPHAVSGALKSYLRELPEPLLTFSLYSEWTSAAVIPDFDSRLQALWQVLQKLPETNFKNLRYIIKFLSKILENVEVNKMSSQNIAIVMAPNLIWSPTEDSTSLGMNMTTASLHTLIIDTFISYADWFFPESNIINNQLSSATPNLNANRKIINEPLPSEVNGNNLQPSSGISADPPPSPRSPHRKSTAPPPPHQRLAESPTTDLMDFNSIPPIDETSSTSKPIEPRISHDKPLEPNDSKATATKSFDNYGYCESEVTFRSTGKPTVPSKPNSYSTGSLDRRSYRSSTIPRPSAGGGANKVPEVMSRSSHIERPSVPPPDRPSKTISSDNLLRLARGEEEQQMSETETLPKPVAENESIKPSNPAFVQERERNEPEVFLRPVSDHDHKPVTHVVKLSKPPRNLPEFHKSAKIPEEEAALPASVNSASSPNSDELSKKLTAHIRSKSIGECVRSSEAVDGVKLNVGNPTVPSKSNRFDFLVNQKEEKPPERPPRSESSKEVEVQPERPKPPRPQPPVPAKPKLPSSPIESSDL